MYYCKDIVCRDCPYRDKCISGKSKRKLILRKQTQSAYEAQCEKNDTPEYFAAMKLRQIWCEGNFSHQKANHNLKRVRTRGLGKATMHCLLSATALNLKRMVKLLTGRLLLRKIRLFTDRYAQNVCLSLFFLRLSTAPKWPSDRNPVWLKTNHTTSCQDGTRQ